MEVKYNFPFFQLMSHRWVRNVKKKPTALQLCADTYWVNNITLVTVLFCQFSIDHIFMLALLGKAVLVGDTNQNVKEEGPGDLFDLIGSFVAGSTLCTSALRGQENYWHVLSFNAHSLLGRAVESQLDRQTELYILSAFVLSSKELQEVG